MAFAGANGVTKLDYARLLAAALAHLVAGQGDASAWSSTTTRVRQYIPQPRRPLAPAQPAGRADDRLEPSGGTAAAAALRRGVDLLKRRGLLLLFSDLYDDEEAVEAELRRAIRMGHEVAVFHVLTPDEMTLGARG